ncbi:SpoIID/LytB domain-containing protein [Alicyclobacillus mengziensis]|uniref:SpoIID/LytB domain-containing protein n=1 Tax=Alicyclobacillus mengziensis TaxID=2931921 RepID=A0A9X7VXI7_9BACL|nr:SpoIID/LytB domain-containing protein [Alicyclobacillus mengziensis]QSO46873.1 SpoIID/LytB domain-containing protein [Alicyclobacillus mengziensis]
MQRFLQVSLALILTTTACIVYPDTAKAQVHSIFNTSYPKTIRVAIRANNNPVSPILYVQTLGFEEYCQDVLPNEWGPSWNLESLKAGAIAIKMFAWYYTLHPTTESGFTYDVDNTTNFQEFKYLSGRVKTDLATQETWNMVYVPANGAITQLNYRAGAPFRENRSYLGTYMMSQWGSEYWGSKAKLPFESILRMYYPGYTLKFV